VLQRGGQISLLRRRGARGDGGRDDYEIILVDDESPIVPWSACTPARWPIPTSAFIDNPVNLGLGGSYKRGAKAVRDLVVQPNDSGLRVGTRRVFLMVVIALLPADAAHSIEVAATNQRHQAP
jgi:hypothetical protein